MLRWQFSLVLLSFLVSEGSPFAFRATGTRAEPSIHVGGRPCIHSSKPELVTHAEPLASPEIARVTGKMCSTASLAAAASPSASSELHPSRGGVHFLVSKPSLDHLSCIEGNFGKYKGSEWTMAKTVAIGGGAAGAVASYLVGHELAAATLSSPDLADGVSYMATVVGAGLGWVAAGGGEVSKDENRRVDGGTEVKYVADRPERLSHIVDRVSSEAERGGAVSLDVSEGGTYGLRQAATRIVHALHAPEYLEELRDAVDDARVMGKPRRLRFEYSRTMIDGGSYEAALSAAEQWMEATRVALTSDNKAQVVPFALTRPPSHHATRRRGVGGCLLSSIAIATKYALDDLGASNVAILDIDAHHGNGIANTVQDDPRIRYCSIHERVKSYRTDEIYDPRSPDPSDKGPIQNLLNVVLEPGATWDNGYEEALVEDALPFLKQGRPDVLLVAAGFDALEADLTSSLALIPSDFERVGDILKREFGRRIVFGLEGGYTWKSGELGEAVLNLARPWC